VEGRRAGPSRARGRTHPQLPWLGYSVLLIPMDVMPYRRAAAMMFGTFHGLGPDDMIDMQTRRRDFEDGDGERTFLVFAVRSSLIEERRLSAEP
jgi:hypothetical protein